MPYPEYLFSHPCRIIDGAVAKEATLMGRSLSVAWVDYKKALIWSPTHG